MLRPAATGQPSLIIPLLHRQLLLGWEVFVTESFGKYAAHSTSRSRSAY
ncbi:hypothetical protein ANO14919_074190 [Xylariales sp. No.14919]|nr:hypothetical protein ANO14919_074190 [Xylariales sp. No.14919]